MHLKKIAVFFIYTSPKEYAFDEFETIFFKNLREREKISAYSGFFLYYEYFCFYISIEN